MQITITEFSFTIAQIIDSNWSDAEKIGMIKASVKGAGFSMTQNGMQIKVRGDQKVISINVEAKTVEMN